MWNSLKRKQMEETIARRGPARQVPEGVKEINLDGRQVFLVPTAHISKRSVDEVRRTIEATSPDVVCVELCEARYRNIVDREAWKNTNIVKVILQGKAMLLLASLVMVSFQKRLGARLGVKPGAEMIEAIRAAREGGAELVLADRDIQITLKRTWARLGIWDRVKILFQLTASLFGGDEIDEETIEQLKEEEKLGDVLKLLADEFPNLKETLIDERDVYLAQQVREKAGRRTVAIVGAGHVPGMLSSIEREEEIGTLQEVPPAGILPRMVRWAVPVSILVLVAVGFIRGDTQESLQSIYIWCLVNGTLAAVGAALALAHPLTILSAFLAAPLTSLNPMIAAGWVAGLVQCVVKKPTVKDLEDLPEAIESVQGFWGNPATRILLVVVLANLGSVVGTFVSGSWIAARFF